MTSYLPALLLLLAQPQPTSSDATRLLARARQTVLELADRMVNFTCSQRIVRSQFPSTSAARNDCAAPYSTGTPYLRDRIRLEVASVDGHEMFAWPDGPRFESDNPDALLGGGVSGSGDYNGFISAIFLAKGIEYTVAREQEEGGQHYLVYNYKVPLASSRYYVAVGPRRVPMDYEGSFWLHRDTAMVHRIVVNALHPPLDLGACRVTTTIHLQDLTLDTGRLLVPRSTRLEMYNAEGSWALNETTYDSCRAFRAESTLRFDAPEDPGGTQPRTAPPDLPRGANLEIALNTTIGFETAWTGEFVAGTLTTPLRDATNKVLLPKGTRFNGRIVRLQHFTVGKDKTVTLGLTFESFNWQGTPIPLALASVSKPDRHPHPPAFNARTAHQPTIATFNYTNGHQTQTPRNLLSYWAIR